MFPPKSWIFTLACTIVSLHSFGQKNISAEDTISIVKQQRHSPKKAAIFSAVLPGLGQGYNKKYWKIPIVYAGLGGLAFAIGRNTKRWNTYREAYRVRIDGDTSTIDEFVGIYTDNNLLTLKKYYKRNMDLSIIFMSVVYVLNIIDAAVDAHLFEFDIDDNLSLRVQPELQWNSGNSSFAGITIILGL